MEAQRKREGLEVVSRGMVRTVEGPTKELSETSTDPAEKQFIS